jgi:Ulp1 family protease
MTQVFAFSHFICLPFISFNSTRLNERENEGLVHVFASHLLTKLRKNGVSAVTRWGAKVHGGVFSKQILFIPVNYDLHWSLCVVANPGAISNVKNRGQDECPMPCIICLDSTRTHVSEDIADLVRKWLNSEWAPCEGQSGKRPFTKVMQVVCSTW